MWSNTVIIQIIRLKIEEINMSQSGHLNQLNFYQFSIIVIICEIRQNTQLLHVPSIPSTVHSGVTTHSTKRAIINVSHDVLISSTN